LSDNSWDLRARRMMCLQYSVGGFMCLCICSNEAQRCLSTVMKSGRRDITPTILSLYYIVSKNADQASKYIYFESLSNQRTGVKFQKDFVLVPPWLTSNPGLKDGRISPSSSRSAGVHRFFTLLTSPPTTAPPDAAGPVRGFRSAVIR